MNEKRINENQLAGERRRPGLTSFQLKLLAICSMLIDHTGAVLFPELPVLRYIGRLAFPIFCFLLTEGYVHTRDVKKYLLRLAVFAAVSELPFDLALYGGQELTAHQNVFFTLFIGLGMIYLMDREQEVPMRIGSLVLAMWLAEFLHTDYGARGVLLIAVFWLFRDQKALRLLLGAGWNLLWGSVIQYAGMLAMLPAALYNGEKGRSMKYFFYLFYPVHLIVLYAIVRLTS